MKINNKTDELLNRIESNGNDFIYKVFDQYIKAGTVSIELIHDTKEFNITFKNKNKESKFLEFNTYCSYVLNLFCPVVLKDGDGLPSVDPEFKEEYERFETLCNMLNDFECSYYKPIKDLLNEYQETYETYCNKWK